MAKIKKSNPLPSEELVQNLNELSSELSPNPEELKGKTIVTDDHDAYKPKL